MTVASSAPAPARPARLSDLVDAVARTTGAWLLVEQLGGVVCHGVGSNACPPALADTLLSKSTRALRDAVAWRRGRSPMTGELAGQRVTAVDLGEGGVAWFVGAEPSPDALPALAAALHGEDAVLHDPTVAGLLHPRGPSRLGAAPQARLVAVEADVPLQALCRATAAATAGTAVRAHVDDDRILLVLDPSLSATALIAGIASRCDGTVAGTAVTPAAAQDWRSTADIARSALDAARELGLLLADADDAAVAAEVLVQEAAQAVSRLERQLRVAPLGALAKHDARTCGELLPTLRAWCRAGFDNNLAASELHVHVNTLRYRLKRAAAISELQLDQPRQRLALQLMLLD